jgi:hypothetical protein
MGMACSGTPSLHAILEESPSEDDSTSSDGVQCGDHGHPHRYYVAIGGNPDASDHTSGAIADHHTLAGYQNPARVTASLPG